MFAHRDIVNLENSLDVSFSKEHDKLESLYKVPAEREKQVLERLEGSGISTDEIDTRLNALAYIPSEKWESNTLSNGRNIEMISSTVVLENSHRAFRVIIGNYPPSSEESEVFLQAFMSKSEKTMFFSVRELSPETLSPLDGNASVRSEVICPLINTYERKHLVENLTDDQLDMELAGVGTRADIIRTATGITEFFNARFES